MHLKPVGKIIYCEQCGTRCQSVHETTVRCVRDLPLFEYRVVLCMSRAGGSCANAGGPRLEKLDWLGRYQRVTGRFAKACEKLLQAASVQAMAGFYSTPASSRASTTPSRSSSVALTGTAARNTSSSKSTPHSPEIRDEPIISALLSPAFRSNIDGLFSRRPSNYSTDTPDAECQAFCGFPKA